MADDGTGPERPPELEVLEGSAEPKPQRAARRMPPRSWLLVALGVVTAFATWMLEIIVLLNRQLLQGSLPPRARLLEVGYIVAVMGMCYLALLIAGDLLAGRYAGGRADRRDQDAEQ